VRLITGVKTPAVSWWVRWEADCWRFITGLSSVGYIQTGSIADEMFQSRTVQT